MIDMKTTVPSLLCFAIGLSACSSVSPPATSGFLDDYAGMMPDPKDTSLLWWERDGFDWRGYEAVAVDPIVIYFHPESEGREIRAEALAGLAIDCRAAIVQQLESEYRVVEKPDAGVMRVRAAMTDVIPANVGLNILTTVVAFVPLDMGGAAMEVEFIDGGSGERVAAGIDEKLGIPTQLRAGFTSLGHARRACDDWAEELLIALKTNP